jgi:hypothetical protein
MWTVCLLWETTLFLQYCRDNLSLLYEMMTSSEKRTAGRTGNDSGIVTVRVTVGVLFPPPPCADTCRRRRALSQRRNVATIGSDLVIRRTLQYLRGLSLERGSFATAHNARDSTATSAELQRFSVVRSVAQTVRRARLQSADTRLLGCARLLW